MFTPREPIIYINYENCIFWYLDILNIMIVCLGNLNHMNTNTHNDIDIIIDDGSVDSNIKNTCIVILHID